MADFQADTAQLDAFARQLSAAGVDLADLGPVNSEAGREVLSASRPPRRSGVLSASLQADVSRQGVAFGSTARYWTFVHWGAPRRNIRARPWFPEAVQLTRDELLAVYARHARKSFNLE